MDKDDNERNMLKYVDELSDNEKVYVAWALNEYLNKYVEPVKKSADEHESQINQTLKIIEEKIKKLEEKINRIKEKDELNEECGYDALIPFLAMIIVFLPGILKKFSVEQLWLVLASGGVTAIMIKKIIGKIEEIQTRRTKKIYSDLDELKKLNSLCEEFSDESIRLKYHYHGIKNTINGLINN